MRGKIKKKPQTLEKRKLGCARSPARAPTGGHNEAGLCRCSEVVETNTTTGQKRLIWQQTKILGRKRSLVSGNTLFWCKDRKLENTLYLNFFSGFPGLVVDSPPQS